MRWKNRALALVLAVFMALACAGCMGEGADRLYALPQLSDEYVQLESLIAGRIREGSEYAAPVGGSNRQSVQLHDLDGDGEAEAIAFLADSTHTPTVCVYRRTGAGDYFLDVIISGEGSAVSSVEYADINNDGATEVIIAWQISGDIRLLSVYSLTKEEHTALLSADCSEFYVCDLDGDGAEELLVLRPDADGAEELVRYVFTPDGGTASSAAPLSSGITEVLRTRTGYLSDGVTAFFIESRWGGDELVTDVFAAASGTLSNITVAASGRSSTLRPGEAFAADINGDRVMEIPEASGDILNWYGFDSSGRRTLALTTYHDYDGGWYLALGEAMMSSLSVSVRSDVAGERAATFTVTGPDGGREDALRIYALTGENRLDRAGEAGRVILAQNETTVYAAELLAQELLTQEEIADSFNLIYPEWQM